MPPELNNSHKIIQNLSRVYVQEADAARKQLESKNKRFAKLKVATRIQHAYRNRRHRSEIADRDVRIMQLDHDAQTMADMILNEQDRAARWNRVMFLFLLILVTFLIVSYIFR